MEDLKAELDYLWWKIKNTICRPFYRFKIMYRWLPVLWQDHNWDYAYILYALQHKLEETRECLLESEYATKNARAQANKQLTIAINLLNRLDGRVYHSVGEFHRYGTREWAEHTAYLENQDWDLLFKTLRKHMRCWWD